MFALVFSEVADEQFTRLRDTSALAKRFRAVQKALRFLAENPRHPGLRTHEWKSQPCPHGDKLWEAYAENNTPGAYRIFFCYAPERAPTLCIVAITPHP